MEQVRRRVKDNSSVALEWEIKRIGASAAPHENKPESN